MTKFAHKVNGARPRAAAPVAALLLLAAVGLIAGGCGDDEASVAFPPIPPETVQPWLYDVIGTAEDDVWVVGARGAMFHFDGTDWSPVESGTDEAITSLYAPGDGTIWACGYGGRVWRNAGGGWSSMSSPTKKDLFRIGSFDGTMYAVGLDGAAIVYDGGWSLAPGIMVTRNPKEGNAVVDTLLLTEDVASLTAINHYMIGGAYITEDAPTERIGTEYTVGFTMKNDEPIVDPGPPPIDETGLYDWLVRSVGEDSDRPEWVICSWSDDGGEAVYRNNWFGTATGWLFQLREDPETGDPKWVRYSLLPVTRERRHAVRDLWLAPPVNPAAPTERDLYIVTEDGLLVKQEFDGTRTTLYDQLQPLVSVWGTGPQNMYATGYMNEKILRISHDPGAGTTVVTPITLEFPDSKSAVASAAGAACDELGRPRVR